MGDCYKEQQENENHHKSLPAAAEAVEKLTAALGKGQTLTVRILRRVKSLSERALDEEIRRQLRDVVGPNWNDNCIVGYWMMVIVRAPIVRLIEEGRAREINIKGRLTLRARLRDCAHDDVCSICLDKMCSICICDDDNNIATLDCGHEFHMGCVARWLLLRKNFCPLCKARALEIDLDQDVHDVFL